MVLWKYANGRTQIQVSLKEEVSALDEVVVIGYGTTKNEI
jgi:hypothetical protein